MRIKKVILASLLVLGCGGAISLNHAKTARALDNGGTGPYCVTCKTMFSCGTTLGNGGASCDFNRWGRCSTWGMCIVVGGMG